MKKLIEKRWRSVFLISVALIVICWFANSWVEKQKQCVVEGCSSPASCVSPYEGDWFDKRLCATHTGPREVQLEIVLERAEKVLEEDTGFWKVNSRSVRIIPVGGRLWELEESHRTWVEGSGKLRPRKNEQCMYCNKPVFVMFYGGDVRMCAEHADDHINELDFHVDRIRQGLTHSGEYDPKQKGPTGKIVPDPRQTK